MKSSININSRRAEAMEISDIQLIEGLRAGDERMLNVLYRKYYVMVLKYVLSNSGREEEARDLYQDTLVVLYENVQKSEFALTCALQTYIYSVSRRLWLKQLQKKGRMVLLKEEAEHDIEDAGAAVEEHLKKEEEIERAGKSLAELGEPCASLITDFYIHRLSMEQIAEKFGYTNSDNAKNQKYKCLQRLKKHFFEKSRIAQQ